MQQNELQHYGVKGMRWGIRRAQKKLAKASTQEQKNKAVAKLQKHRSKAVKQVAKLEKKVPKLEKAYDRAVLKTDVKIAKAERDRSYYARKATRPFMSENRANKYLNKAQLMDMKVKELKAYSDSAKAAMAQNKRMRELFNTGISEIDAALIEAGKKRITG